MDFTNNIFGKKEHLGGYVRRAASSVKKAVGAHLGLDAETLFLQRFKGVGDFWPERKESILFITAGVNDGSGLGNMKIKDSSYNHKNVRMHPIGRWKQNCNYPRMKKYIKKRYDTCKGAFSEITDPLNEQITQKDTEIGFLIQERNRLKEERRELKDIITELNIQNKKDGKAMIFLDSKIDKVGKDIFLPNKMIDNFAPFKNVEHLTMREKANQWVEQQNIIRRDYISRLDNIQSEVDLEIENTLNNGNKLLNYKRFTRATIFLIKVAILTIIIFIGWYIVKMIRER